VIDRLAFETRTEIYFLPKFALASLVAMLGLEKGTPASPPARFSQCNGEENGTCERECVSLAEDIETQRVQRPIKGKNARKT
jgi:hypothetical protein